MSIVYCQVEVSATSWSHRLWCVVECDLETSGMRRPWPALGRRATEKKNRPLLSSCLKLWTSPRVTHQFGCCPQRLPHGTRYKHIWPLYQNHVTRLVNYPAILVFRLISAVTYHRLTFTVGARGARLRPNTRIKRLRIQQFWAFDHYFIPKLLVTTRLGLGIQKYLSPPI